MATGFRRSLFPAALSTKNAVMGMVVVDDIEMYYESRGSGPALVMIGGLGIEMSELDTLIAPLSTRFRVVAFDNRGAGRSSKPRGPYSIEQMAGDVAALMDRLDLPCAHVFGISMGGRIALALALAHPERADRLVLVSTGPRAGGARWLVRLGMLVSDLPLLRGPHRQPRYALKAQFDATSRFDCSQRLGEIDQPTLILHGSSDHVAPVALAEQMHARIPNSRLVLFEGGHLFTFSTQQEGFVALVGAFLTSSR
jgi:pimeloyl-ACP methyl ester carboxylesterase